MYAILIKVYNKRHTGTYYRAISYVTIDSYTSRRKYSFSITEPGNIMQFGTLQFALRVVEYIKQDSTKGSIILPEILDVLIIEHDVAAEYIAYQKELFSFSKRHASKRPTPIETIQINFNAIMAEDDKPESTIELIFQTVV